MTTSHRPSRSLEPTETVYTDSETLIGTTEPGADIQITDGAGHEIESSIDADGRFSATLDLHVGDNNVTLHSTDIAGNHASTTYTVGARFERGGSSS